MAETASDGVASATAVGFNGKPSIGVVDQVAHLISGGSWSVRPTAVTYSFDASAPGPMPEGAGGFSPFSAGQIAGAELALQAWADVADIAFQRIGAGYSNEGTLRFAAFTSGQDGSAAFTYLPENGGDRSAASPQGDSWYNASLAYLADPKVFGYGQHVLVHEIGHALGLTHPGDYDAGRAAAEPITYARDAAFLQDSLQYTVMSYFSEANSGADFGGAYAAAPQLADIAAIQAVYGPNLRAFLSDTTYGFNATAGRPWFAAVGPDQPMVFAVWDAGGSDTFDFSGYRQAQRIDLNAGQFSDVGGLRANVAIAQGTTIENAVGGSGGDTLVGNAAGNAIRGLDGNDSLSGGAGDDDLNGNVGDDVLRGDDGRDWVRGGKGSDLIFGGEGDDPHLNGNLGGDTVRGEAGDDTVFGGQGDDVLSGDAGDDRVSGDVGADVLSGGAGADRFVFGIGFGADWITDFSSAEGDRVQLAAGVAFTLLSHEGQVLIDLGGGDQLGLAGVTAGALGDWLVYA